MEFIGEFARRIQAKKSEVKVQLPQLRFDLDLKVPDEGGYAEFSYRDLVKKATVNRDTAMEPDDEQASVQMNFLKDYLDRGAGYDENDSFIDNDEPYDEFLPPTMSTEFGGFYVNSGPLKLKKAGRSNRKADSQPKKKQTVPNNRKRLSIKPISKLVKVKKPKLATDHGRAKTSKGNGDTGQKKETVSPGRKKPKEASAIVDTPVPELDTDSDEVQIIGVYDKMGENILQSGNENIETSENIPAIASPDEHSKKKRVPKSVTGTAKTKKEDSAKKCVASDHMYACSTGMPDTKDENRCSIDSSPSSVKLIVESTHELKAGGGIIESTDDEAIHSHADNSESDADNLLPPSEMPSDLPLPLREMLCAFSQLAGDISQRKDSQAFLNKNTTNKMLLKIHDFCETVPRVQRSGVFQYMASLFHITPRSLRVRIKKLKKKQNEDKLSNSLSELREEIGNAVLKKEKPKNVFGASAENVHPNDQKDGSQAVGFEWSKPIMKKLRCVLDAKLNLLKESGARSFAITEGMREFAESDILKLWPPGAIDPAILHKKVQLFLLSREK